MEVLKFRIISSENSDFIREIEIPESKQFYDLHIAIQTVCKYDSSQMTSFYLSNQEWEKLEEISMMPMDDEESETIIFNMKDVSLKDLIKNVGQRLLYLFDFFSVRMMFIELIEIKPMQEGLSLENYPRCTYSEGTAPEAIIIDDSIEDNNSINDYDKFQDIDEFDELGGFENIDDLDI